MFSVYVFVYFGCRTRLRFLFISHFQFPISRICSVAWYLLYKYLIWKRWKLGLISSKNASQMRTAPSRREEKKKPKQQKWQRKKMDQLTNRTCSNWKQENKHPDLFNIVCGIWSPEYSSYCLSISLSCYMRCVRIPNTENTYVDTVNPIAKRIWITIQTRSNEKDRNGIDYQKV